MTVPRRRTRRSSRRDTMLRAALELFAAAAPGSITMGDIAERAGVSPAAVYYHFPSKDHMLRECVRRAGEQCVDTVAAAIAELPPLGGLTEVVDVLLRWLDAHEEEALVLFVTSVGVSLEVEGIRQDARMALLGALTELVHRVRGGVAPAEAAVCAAGLVSLVETAARSWVERDDMYRGLGRRDFQRQLVDLAERMVGVAG